MVMAVEEQLHHHLLIVLKEQQLMMEQQQIQWQEWVHCWVRLAKGKKGQLLIVLQQLQQLHQ